MKARVLSVYDDGAVENTPFIGSSGFSVLVENDGERTLFDTGSRGRYLMHNLDYFDIKCDSIDRVVLSHNHVGNVNGLLKLLDNRTEPLDIYVNSGFQDLKRMFGRPLFSEEQSSKAVIHIMDGNTRFNDNLMAIGPFGDIEEYSLVLSTIKGPVVIFSCCHGGIGQILGEARNVTGQDPYNLIGGIHVKKPKQATIDPMADIIKEFGSPHMYLGHCAEYGAITYMRVRFNLKGVDNFYAGTALEYKVRE